MRKNLLLLFSISLWCLGTGSNELFAKSGYFTADPVMNSVGGHSTSYLFKANTAFANYLNSLANDPPVISGCQDKIIKDADNTCSANVAWNTPTSLDGSLAPNYPQLASTPGVQVFSPYTFPVGNDTVIYLFTNAFGSSECRIPIEVRDVNPPVVSGGSCGVTINAVNDAGECFASNLAITSPSVVDGCAGLDALSYSFVDASNITRTGAINELSALNTSFTFKIGSTIITWTGTDASGNTATCITTVEVTDTELPTLTPAPVGGTFPNDAGLCGAFKGFVSPVADDNCTFAFSWTIFTESGATPGYQPLEDVTAEVTSTGNVDNYFFTVGTHHIVYRVVDASNNEATDVTSVTITDSEDPIFTSCSPAVNEFSTGNNGGYDCLAEVSLLSPAAADNCSGPLSFAYTIYDSNDVALVNDALGNPIGGTGNLLATLSKGNYYAVYTVSDPVGNTSAPCTLNIAVIDDEAPKFTSAPLADLFLVNETNLVCFNDTLISSPNVADNCAGVTLSWLVKQGTSTLASGNGTIPSFAFPVGLTSVIWIATDAEGQSVTDTVVITVSDVTNPTLNAGADVNLNVAANACSALVTQNITFSDNCGIASIVENSAIGSFSNVDLLAGTATFSGTFPVGAPVTVTVTVTDVNGNISTDAFTISINDVTNPTINNFANINQPTNTGVCTFTRSFNIATDFLPMDNCSIVSTVVDFDLDNDTQFDDEQLTFTGATGSFAYTFNKGFTGVRVTVTDASGNTASDVFNVNISDLEAPLVSYQDTVVVGIDPNSCTTALVGLELTDANVSDNCSNDAFLLANTTNDYNANGADATDNFVLGYTTVTWTVTDMDGNSTNQSVVVWVRDVTLPSDSPNDTLNILADIGLCSGKVKVFAPVSLDACGIAKVEHSINGAARVEENVINGFAFPVGTNIVQWFTTDQNNNERIDTAVVIVTDSQDPIISGPNFYTFNAGNVCVKDTTVSVSVTDNCDNNTAVTWELIHFTDALDADGDTLTGTGTSVSFAYPAGSNPSIITFTAEDVNGNVATKVVTVTVNDTQAPTVTCPGDLVFNTNTAICGAVVTLAGDNELVDSPITDNCGIASITGVYGASNIPFDPTSPMTFDLGTTSVTITITDNNGNSTNCTFNVTVEDNVGPGITSFPNNITVTTLPNECAREVFWTEPVASDNCTGSNFTVVASHINGQDFPIGTTTVTYTFTDQNGNATTRSFTITVNDVQNPVINSLPGNTTLYLPANACSAVLAYEANVQDNCGAQTLTTTATYPSGSQLGVGSFTNVFTVTDASGNSATGSFNITVIDTIKPTFPVFPSNIVSCNPVVTYNVEAADNCAVTAGTIPSTQSGATFPLGVTTVVWTATDVNGNSTTRSFTVTVVSPTTIANAGNDAVACLDGSTITLVGNAPANGESVQWSTNTPAGIVSPNAATTAVNINSAGVYTFRYTITGAAACPISTDEVVITVNAQPSQAIAGNDQIVSSTTATLNAIVPANGIGTWTTLGTANIINPNVFNTQVNNLSVGENIFVWTISVAGCSTSSSDEVKIIVDGRSIVQSNAFSPNGDGDNDTFEIPLINQYPQAVITIYNRWGNEIFTATGANYGKGWDGTFEGTDVPVASYYYVIDLQDGSPLLKGYVSVIR
ncbi:MAG TPA: HYR domain-containing protein [Luteibaculaceae bacterium]|nr:HYR domain-containing protein [Luteibaculaceae bacterium]